MQQKHVKGKGCLQKHVLVGQSVLCQLIFHNNKAVLRTRGDTNGPWHIVHRPHINGFHVLVATSLTSMERVQNVRDLLLRSENVQGSKPGTRYAHWKIELAMRATLLLVRKSFKMFLTDSNMFHFFSHLVSFEMSQYGKSAASIKVFMWWFTGLPFSFKHRLSWTKHGPDQLLEQRTPGNPLGQVQFATVKIEFWKGSLECSHSFCWAFLLVSDDLRIFVANRPSLPFGFNMWTWRSSCQETAPQPQGTSWRAHPAITDGEEQSPKQKMLFDFYD